MGREQVEEGNGAKKRTPGIIVSAGIFSALWIGATAVLFLLAPIPDQCDGPIRCMKMNEMGDFIAGASAPLAFLWLVVAVFIQSHELSEQRAELRLTRKEFEENRKVMTAQADFIGIQTELLQKQALEDERVRQDLTLENTLTELSLMIEQHLYNRIVMIGTRTNGTRGPAPMIQRGHDRDGWIIAFANYLYNLENTGLERPYIIESQKVSEVGRVYDLCQQLGKIALVNGGEALHKLDRLRVSDIRIFFDSNLWAQEPDHEDDTASYHGASGFCLPRAPGQVDEDNPDPEPA